jgi:hypothetical protein
MDLPESVHRKKPIIKAGRLRGQCILFSVVFTHPPKPSWQGLAATCHLSTLSYHCIAGAGLPVHMIGEVSWEAQRRRASI